MISNRLVLALALAALVIAAPAARAQYMYLDANGNGVHDPGDQLAPNGSPTTVDVWLDTNHNRDGSLATCDVDPTMSLPLNDYIINLQAAGGLVSYSGFVTHFGNPPLGEFNPGDGIRYANGLVGIFTTLPPGLHRIATLTITGTGGTPQVSIVDRVNGALDITMFSPGTSGCFGNDFDNAYKLTGPAGGTDWTDVDGLNPAPGEVGPPVLNAIGNKTVNEGACLTFTATGSAPNGSPVTFYLPPGAPPGTSITSGGQFSWCPTETQGPGVYAVTVCVLDNVTQLTDCETFTVTVLEVNQAPVLNPIGNKTVPLASLLTFTATATDADVPANTLTFSLDPGAPAGATIGAATGVFSWTPNASGTFPVTIRVTDNGTPPLSDSETILITTCLGCGIAAPVLGPIGNKTVNELALLSFTATATDPDPGQTLTFLLGAGNPAGSAITAGGAFTWTPTEAQGPGVYPITVIVTDNGVGNLSDSETIQVTVNEVNQAPVLAPIGNKTGVFGAPLTFTATATDADLPMNTLTFSLDPGAPAGATIDPVTGGFTWTPTSCGTFPVTIRVTDNGSPPLSDAEAISIVLGCGAPPVLQAIADMTVDEGGFVTQTIYGGDPGSLPLTFTKVSGPLWMTVQTLSPTTGLISLSPDYAAAGTYQATVRASNGSTFDQKSFTINVNNSCRPPTANAGGPYSGTVGVPVSFSGGGSSSPDGDALTYLWSFGDGDTGTGVAPMHVYSSLGTYMVELHVSDSCGLSDTDTATATISQCFSALAFVTGGNKQINLGSGKPATCVQIQPTNGSFAIQSVDLSSVVMSSPGTGSVQEIHAQGTKTSLSGDRNNDGIDEIAACFRKEDLQQLFSGLAGTQTVQVVLQGDVTNGGRFCTGLALTVKAGGGGNLAASVSPNPLNPSAVLTFHTEERGPVLVQLFDVRGRLLRTLLEESDAAAGYHDVRIDGTSASGSRLSSGIYFVRVRAGAEEERKTITILK